VQFAQTLWVCGGRRRGFLGDNNHSLNGISMGSAVRVAKAKPTRPPDIDGKSEGIAKEPMLDPVEGIVGRVEVAEIEFIQQAGGNVTLIIEGVDKEGECHFRAFGHPLFVFEDKKELRHSVVHPHDLMRVLQSEQFGDHFERYFQSVI
jgi:hypothetical protein